MNMKVRNGKANTFQVVQLVLWKGYVFLLPGKLAMVMVYWGAIVLIPYRDGAGLTVLHSGLRWSATKSTGTEVSKEDTC